MVSHDLTSPLRAVKTYAEELTKDIGVILAEHNSEKLNKIEGISNSLLKLVEDLMVYAKIGQSKEKKTEVKLTNMINKVLFDLEELIIETGGKVEAEQLGVVQAVPNEIQILFHTLIENGLKYHRDGVPPIVEISGEKMKDSYKVVIKDNGRGFDEKQTEKIIWAFRDLQVTSGKYLGLGVGLRTCMKIIENHRGSFAATGKLGEGSIFTLMLPQK